MRKILFLALFLQCSFAAAGFEPVETEIGTSPRDLVRECIQNNKYNLFCRRRDCFRDQATMEKTASLK